MKSTVLIPGRTYDYTTAFNDVLPAVFVERVPAWSAPMRKPINIFVVPAFAGLNGPDDKGITHFSDHSVRKQISPAKHTK